MKSVILNLEGNLQQGFVVIIQIWELGNTERTELRRKLPASPELLQAFQEWRQQYQDLENFVYRSIRPTRIIYDGFINPREQCQELANVLTERLQEWFNSPEFLQLDSRLATQLAPEDNIRVLLRSEDEAVQQLPWHLWDFFKRYPQAEIALSPVDFDRSNRNNKNFRSTVRILAILGNSEGIEVQNDREILKNLPNTEIVFLDQPSRQQLNEAIRQDWEIIFFSGHSETQENTGRLYINSTENLETNSLTIDELWYALKSAVKQGLKLAIFNSCDSLGLANRLNDLQIPQMIVMRGLVPDRVAQAFLRYFLEAFVTQEKPLYLAVREARERLQGIEDQFPCATWLPVIWQHPNEVSPTWRELFQELTTRHISYPIDWQKLLIASVIVTCAIIGIKSLGFLEPFELKAYDHLMRSRPKEPLDERILIVEATEQDLQNKALLIDKLEEPTLSDQTIVNVLEKLEKYQPRVIGLDILRDIPLEPGHAEFLSYIQQNENIVVLCGVRNQQEDNLGRKAPDGIQDITRIGFHDILSDENKLIIRRDLLAMFTQPSPCQNDKSLTFQLAQNYLLSVGIKIEKSISESYFRLNDAVFKSLEKDNRGGYHNLDDRGYQIMLNYRSSYQVAPKVTLTQVLNDSVNPNLVKDRIILIGYGSKISFLTPYSLDNSKDQKMPGVMIRAHSLSQILSAVLDNRPLIWLWPKWGEFFWNWMWAILGGVLAWRWRYPLLLGLSSASLIVFLYTLCLVILCQGGWVPLIPPALGIIITSAVIIIETKRDQQRL